MVGISQPLYVKSTRIGLDTGREEQQILDGEVKYHLRGDSIVGNSLKNSYCRLIFLFYVSAFVNT